MSDDSAMIHNRAMIVNNLAMLVKNKCNLSVALGGKETLLTVLLAINHQDGTVVLDYGSSDYLNKKLLKVRSPGFKTVFNGIQVSFHVGGVTKGKYRGSDCFIIDIPSQLYWYNRREYYRVDCPSAASSYIQIELDEPEEDAKLEVKEAYSMAMSKIQQKLIIELQQRIAEEKEAFQRAYSKMNAASKAKANAIREKFEENLEVNSLKPSPKLANVIRLNLADISMSGCRLVNVDPEFSAYFQEGSFSRERLLVMPHVRIRVGFKVVSAQVVSSRLGGNEINPDNYEENIGVEFLDLPQSLEGAILRYVQDIERQSGLLDNL
jgi:c-di-GMP-binding flagellar brake protein YcgR